MVYVSFLVYLISLPHKREKGGGVEVLQKDAE